MARPLLPGSLRNLLDDLAKLPGVGPKSAQRILFSLLHRPKAEVEKFAKDLLSLEDTTACGTCGMLAEQAVCAVCGDAARDRGTICVVETPVDVLAVERAGEYRGLYHVLGGVLSPLERVGADQLNIPSLLRRAVAPGLREIILALNPSTEGETTTLYLQDALKGFGGAVTRIAQGLPTGAALEFADDLTIVRALSGRQEIRKAAVPAREEARRSA